MSLRHRESNHARRSVHSNSASLEVIETKQLSLEEIERLGEIQDEEGDWMASEWMG